MSGITNKAFLALTAALLVQSPAASYPQIEMTACMQSAFNAVIQKGLSATRQDLEDFCDCSLRKIFDEGREITSSIEYCNARYGL